jgi:hypothetical protein
MQYDMMLHKYQDECLRLEMIIATFRDKLEDLGEEEFIDWVEKQFPKEKK